MDNIAGHSDLPDVVYGNHYKRTREEKGRVITLKMRLKTNKTHNKHWGPDTNPFIRSPYDFLAVGVLQIPEGNHAVFVK